MPDLARVTSRESWFFAALWPLVFLAPLVPKLPRPAIVSFPWRQEFYISFLLVVTLTLLINSFRRSSSGFSRIPIRELWVILPLAAYVVWTIISLLWAQGWLHTAHYNVSWIVYVVCFLLMRRIAEQPRLLRLSLFSLAVVISILGIVSTIEFWTTDAEVYQFGLLLRRSTGLGEPLAVSVPIFASLAITLRKIRAALVCGISAVLAWLATLQSLERAPLAGLAAGLLLLVAAMIVRKPWRPRRPVRALILLTAFVAAAGVQSLTSSSSFTRLRESNAAEANTQVRFLVWAIGLEMLREHPFRGVGANNYELAYPTARARFSARHPDSPVIGSEEDLLVQRAHNEYVQILAELGLVGFAIFLTFCGGLIYLGLKVLRSARNPLALGAFCSLTTFAISSGASSISFRWLSSGLLFFWASAITARFASSQRSEIKSFVLSANFVRGAATAAFPLVLVAALGAGCVGVNSILHGMALAHPGNDSSTGGDSPEHLYRMALRWNSYDGPTHFDFGGWLYGEKRYREAVTHLRLATERGLNSSTCFAFLAGAEAAAGDLTAAEQTLSHAVHVFPRSVFLRVRHAIALAETGNSLESSRVYQAALELDPRAARGWRQLMCFGPRSAYDAANQGREILSPKDLRPASWAYPAIAEQETRPPSAYPIDVGSSKN